MAPKLSIIIPTYRRTESLSNLIASLRRQTLRDLEIVLVDQNPQGFLLQALPDGSLAEINHHYLDEPNASRARNFGFSLSSGKYVLFLDDDFSIDPEFCAKAIDTLERTQVCCSWALVYGAEGAEQRFANLQPFLTGAHLDGTALYELKESGSGALFFERKYFADSGGFDELLFRYAGTAEDQELSLRMRKRGMQIWLDRSLLVFHDESVAGGCELRTQSYQQTRARCVKAWVFRYMIHNKRKGGLSWLDKWELMRSSFLNGGMFVSSPRHTLSEINLLLDSIRECREYLDPYLGSYSGVEQVNHLLPYQCDIPAQA